MSWLPISSTSITRMDVLEVDPRLDGDSQEYFMKIRRTLLAAAMTLAFAAASAPALADDTVTVTKGTHHYVYYRDHEIYFAPESKTYYWMSEGKWQSGPVLPTESQAYVHGSGV